MLVQGPLHLVGEVSVRGRREEREAWMDDLASVEGLLPLAGQECVGGEDERGDGEVGYAECAA